MRVFVTGGTGYVGRPMVERLLKDGHDVKVLTRSESRAAHWGTKVSVVVGDLFDDTALKLGMDASDAVVHLVGVIREHPRQKVTMQRVHTEGTKVLVKAALEANISRLVHMSALGARPDAYTAYHQSKWNAEKVVRQSGLQFTIFRPSIIFGKGGQGSSFVGQLANVIRSSPFVPIIGTGEYRMQPVHTSVVAKAFSDALTSDATAGETFELGGPSAITYESIVRSLMEHLGTRKPIVHIPLAMLEVMIRSLGWLPGFPLTQDQVAMLIEENVCTSVSRAYEIFQLPNVPFSISEEEISRP